MPDRNAPAAAEELLLERHRDALRERFPMPSAEQLAPRKRQGKAAAALALITIVVGLVGFDPAYHHEHFTTAVGERQRIALSDGSHVTLNTDSSLDIAWHLRSRRASLPAGQALFEVDHAIYRPFLVQAGDTAIRVVGTVFDVRHDDAVTVTVLHGVVAVRRGAAGEEILLSAGQRLRSTREQSGIPETVDATASTAWKDGRLILDHTPLREALAEIQRYSPTPIVLGDQHLGRLQVSGVLAIDNAAAALQLLPQILPVKLVATGQGGIRVDAAQR